MTFPLNPVLSLADRHAVVTGANGTLGAAVAQALVDRGCRALTLHYRSEASSERVRGLADRLSTLGAKITLRHADLSDTHATERLADELKDAVLPVDLLVHCAGVAPSALLVATASDTIEKTFAVNVFAPIALTRAVLPSMIRRRHGAVVFVTSVASLRPFRGQSIYASSKAALEGLVRGLAVEYGRKGVRILGVRPGPFESAMTAGVLSLDADRVRARTLTGSLVSVESVAHTIAFLATEGASGLTGTMVEVDGGYGVQ
ncbi:MAG: SDR family oxidoreductase [Deltaproteobacteria bacterium]|nr:SDR family oxidoreductase [Deltaproteobacteria bacterium]